MNSKIVLGLDLGEEDGEEILMLARRVDLRQLLRDAFGEFVSVRSPVADYVKRRYAGLESGSASRAFAEAKEKDVERRSRLATLLKRADPELRREQNACGLYKLVLIQQVQLAALAGENSTEAYVMRRRVMSSVGYDVHVGFVVAARSEARARVLACEFERDTHRVPGDSVGIRSPSLADEWKEAAARRWLDPSRAICEAMGVASGEDAEAERIVLSSFRNG